MAILSIPLFHSQSLNPYYAWDACASPGSLQAIAQSSVGSGCNNLLPVSYISTTIQHGGQKSDTRAKLPEIFEAK